ncbi:phosphomannomutase [Cognatiyoonia sp. IB215446]|uniref:phosphomannomutase n=1 Tax=Cognatiyoonia sp. IB215446 TaxID=3097355 RepID=UPI002A0C4D72|nr:phosphomannomutase [Cognatiyoonia sp. IB215446]MDX8349944.1 phosphomannomutase [Cognatiyoonia sp. IB215446]
MAPKFGTSGLRGLVTELTSACVTDHVRAFAAACPTGTGLFVAHDLRPSSPDIAEMVMLAGREADLQVTMCGAVPTPALALAAMTEGAAAVMVTGSHIPADRNGLKFYTPNGEITKAHEAAILDALGKADTVPPSPAPRTNDTVSATYIARYVEAYGAALAGRHIGVYGHSAVGRDLLVNLLLALSARVTRLGWSDTFVPVDTEAVAPALRQQLKEWANAHHCDAIVSTDGDGDRPLVADEAGEVITGDILGQISAAALQADHVVTPVSSNSGVERGGQFQSVTRTRIGSPYVIAGMEASEGRVVGYEANGGFLLGFSADGPAGLLAPLMTRDAVLPIIATLVAAGDQGLSARVAAEPARFTAADRLQEVPIQKAQDLVAELSRDAARRAQFLERLGGTESAHNTIDGPRMTLTDGRIVHVRPSGNAPELRLYVEADSIDAANDTLKRGLAELASALDM